MRAPVEETMARVMEVSTPLGEDVLLFHRMHARDEISRVPNSSSICSALTARSTWTRFSARTSP
jgi:hypothetical protein